LHELRSFLYKPTDKSVGYYHSSVSPTFCSKASRLREDQNMKSRVRRFSLLVVLVAGLSEVCFAQSAGEIRPLEHGQSIERELAGGVSHAYSINLTTGQFLHAAVDQRGIDVVVKLFAPDGRLIEEVDGPSGSSGAEAVSCLAPVSGVYQLEVSAVEKQVRPGRYEVKIEALREATPEDKKTDRVKAFAAALTALRSEEEGLTLLAMESDLITEALWTRLSAFGRRQPPRAALIPHRLALNVAERIAYREGMAESLHDIGRVFHSQNNFAKALEFYEKSLPLSEQLPEKRLLATVLVNTGAAHRNLGKPELALKFFTRVLELAKASKDTGVMTARQNLGGIYREQGNFSAALEQLNEVLRLSEERQLSTWKSRTLIDIGLVYRDQGNQTKASEVFQQALALAGELENKPLIATALDEIGWSNFLRGDHLQALEYFQKSLPFREALGDKNALALTLNRMSLSYRLQGDFVKALAYGQRALSLSESLGNTSLTANVWMSIGLVHDGQGDLSQALAAYRQSLTFAEASGNRALIANAFEKIAAVNHAQGRFAEAIEYFQKSLKLNEELGIKRQIIFSLNSMAWVNRSQGDYAQAMENYQRSLRLSQELGNKFQIGNALNGIGVVYFDQGNYPQAFEYYQRSLKIREEAGDVRGVFAGLHNLGEIYRAQDDYEKALDYFHRSLSLEEKMGSKGAITDTLNNIGEIHLAQANYTQALEYFRKSLALSEQSGNRLTMAFTLTGLANVYVAQGNYRDALEFADRAATIAMQSGNRNQLWRALTTVSRAYQGLNRSAEARKALEEAIVIVESIRTNISGQGARASYFATVQKPYELYIDLLMQAHKQAPADNHDAFALQLNERAHARSLLEALSEASADIRQGVDPSLLQRERTLQQQLNAAGERQTRLLTEKHADEQAAKLKKEIDELTTALQDAQAEIRQSSPRYAALTQPAPLDLKGIQALLDADTLLLEYALGEERSYLWAVTPTSIKSFELPKRSEIETDVRRAVGLLNDGQQWTTSDKIESEYAQVAGRLSQMLLAPVAAELKVTRLVIVGDGALHYLPFSALPSRRAAAPNSKTEQSPEPLIAHFEIVSLPSASTLAVLRRETAKRTRGAGSVAVIADPVFEATDERVQALSQRRTSTTAVPSTRGTTPSELTDSRALLVRAFNLESKTSPNGTKRDIPGITRLPFTRFEAEGILASAPRNQRLRAMDFRASRETATGPDLAKYRFLHFATHGILNTEHPELSGIVLSLVNEQGQPIDGFLRLHEIYNLDLPADLIVLSACQTGLGKEIRAEGLVGLTRGFMYAGAPRVVASLWKVDDASTAELMKRFYVGLLKDNLRPAAALRRAKVEMWKQKRWRAPFYWAAFELQGEWR